MWISSCALETSGVILVRTGLCGLVAEVAGGELEMGGDNSDLLGIFWQPKVDGALVAFVTHPERASLLLRLKEQVSCLGGPGLVQILPCNPLCGLP